MSRVLVTRAAPDAAATAARLRAAGHEAVMSPVLIIESVAATIDPAARALVFTSAAGVRALADPAGAIPAHLRALPAFAVGDATAETARAAGFAAVAAGGGDSLDLVALIAARLPIDGGPVVHISGADVAEDLCAALQTRGYSAQRAIVYRAAPAAALTATALERLRERPPGLDAVLLHSARGAESLVALLTDAGLDRVCARLDALCLSPRVAEIAKSLAWRRILVASAPREAVLLTLLGPTEGERT